jgi:hypothetical protein
MEKSIYRWNGDYFGFIYNDRLFNKHSIYLGWVDGTEVWRTNGTFLGEIIDNDYILRRTYMAARSLRAIKATPATPAIPAMKANRAAKAIPSGYIDALDEF